MFARPDVFHSSIAARRVYSTAVASKPCSVKLRVLR